MIWVLANQFGEVFAIDPRRTPQTVALELHEQGWRIYRVMQ